MGLARCDPDTPAEVVVLDQVARGRPHLEAHVGTVREVVVPDHVVIRVVQRETVPVLVCGVVDDRGLAYVLQQHRAGEPAVAPVEVGVRVVVREVVAADNPPAAGLDVQRAFEARHREPGEGRAGHALSMDARPDEAVGLAGLARALQDRAVAVDPDAVRVDDDALAGGEVVLARLECRVLREDHAGSGDDERCRSGCLHGHHRRKEHGSCTEQDHIADRRHGSTPRGTPGPGNELRGNDCERS